MIRYHRCESHYPGYTQTSYNLTTTSGLSKRYYANLSLHTKRKGVWGIRLEVTLHRFARPEDYPGFEHLFGLPKAIKPLPIDD